MISGIDRLRTASPPQIGGKRVEYGYSLSWAFPDKACGSQLLWGAGHNSIKGAEPVQQLMSQLVGIGSGVAEIEHHFQKLVLGKAGEIAVAEKSLTHPSAVPCVGGERSLFSSHR